MNATAPLDSSYRFDPADPDLIRNPYRPYYEYLRSQPGLHKASTEYYVASRHAEVRDVITNYAAFGQGNFVHNIQLYYGPDFDVMAHSSYRWLSEVFVMQDVADEQRAVALRTHVHDQVAGRVAGPELQRDRFADAMTGLHQFCDARIQQRLHAVLEDVGVDVGTAWRRTRALAVRIPVVALYA